MLSIQSNLYTDLQSIREAGRCPHCGGCVYAPSLLCIRCERDRL